MMSFLKPLQVLLITAVVLLTTMQGAHAYIDPGTGSMILQATIASIAAGFAFIRLFWHRIKTFISRLKRSDPEGPQK